jgi:VanZ family protein
LATLGRQFRHNPSAALVKAYAGLLLVGAVVPFTPSIDVTRLVHAVRASTWTPFAQTQALAVQAHDAELSGRLDEAAGFQRERMGLWARWAAELLSFALLGWMLHDLLRTRYGFSPTVSLALTVYVAATLAAAMSAVQLLIMSRGLHLTDTLVRVVGALCGCVYHAVCLVRREPTRVSLVHLWPRLAWPALVVALAFILFTGLMPFQANFSPQAVAEKATAGNVLPFYSYFQGRFDRVCADFWGKTLRFGFLGAAAWMCWQATRGGSSRNKTLATAMAALVLATILECAQLFVRSRVPAATDVIIAAGAAWLGMATAQYVADFYSYSAPRSRRRRTRVTAGESLTATDALVATLVPDGLPDSEAARGSKQPAEQTQHHKASHQN